MNHAGVSTHDAAQAGSLAAWSAARGARSLQPVAHALLQAREEVEALMVNF
jgi:hypothetical protein